MPVYRVSSNNNMTVKNWSATVHQDIRYDNFFTENGLMGDGPNFCVQVKTDLGAKKGDTVYYSLIESHEDDAGRVDDQQLEGFEAEFSDYTDSVLLHKYRHAITFETDMNEIRVKWDLPEEARSQLSRWGTVKLEKLIFAELQKAFTNKVFGGTGNSAINDLGANDKLTPDLVRKIGAIARTGNNGVRTPLRGIRVMGKETLVLLVPPGVAYDVKTDSTWESFQLNANVRGWDNPIFHSAIGYIDDILVMEHRLMIEGNNSGAVHYGTCALLGAQSLCWAWGKRPKMTVVMKDYDDQMGIGYSFIGGVNRTEFDSSTLGEYGCLGVYVAATDLFS